MFGRSLQAMLAVQDSAVEQLARLHARVCPRQILGVRIGQRAVPLVVCHSGEKAEAARNKVCVVRYPLAAGHDIH